MNYTCENCDKTFHKDDMHMIDPVQECLACLEASVDYWYGQYAHAHAHTHNPAAGYDLDDPKHPGWAERKFELVGR